MPSGRPLHQLDPCMVAGSGGETLIARQQRSVERFGERDVDGVICREIAPQLSLLQLVHWSRRRRPSITANGTTFPIICDKLEYARTF